MNGLTPVQTQAIQTWSDTRDKLLREVAQLESQKSVTKQEVTEAGLALTDIHKQIEFAKGRLAEIDALELRLKNSLSTEISNLLLEKQRLETEVTEIKNRIDAQKNEEQKAIDHTAFLLATNDKIATNSNILVEVTNAIITKAEKYVAETNASLKTISELVTQVIEKSNKNLEQTNIVLEKLPKYVFELQRPIPVRRFAEARGRNKIDTDKIEEIRKENAAKLE